MQQPITRIKTWLRKNANIAEALRTYRCITFFPWWMGVQTILKIYESFARRATKRLTNTGNLSTDGYEGQWRNERGW